MGNLENFSELDYKILTVDSPYLDVFPDIINESWGSFFEANPKIFKDRVNSGNIFIGAYLEDKPVGLLETIALKLKESNTMIIQPYQKAREMCEQIGDYNQLTNNGMWKPYEKNSNVLVLVDITVPEEYRGTPIASGIVDTARILISPRNKEEQETRAKLASAETMEKLANLNYALTFTPNFWKIKEWHKKQGAFDTEFVLKNARFGYNLPDVNFMCYIAPGYWAKSLEK